MAEDKGKLTAWDYIARFMAISAFLGVLWAVILGFIAFGEWKQAEKNKSENIETRIFTDAIELKKHRDYVNTDVNPVSVFRQTDTLSKRTDTTIQIQKQLKGLIIKHNTLLDSLNYLRSKKIIYDSLDAIKKHISRNSREKKMDRILKLLLKDSI